MKKYFIGLCWNFENEPYFHLKDFDTGENEFINIPNEIIFERINGKICIGTLNPYTREYISCYNKVEDNESQCTKCKYLYDFYKCVRCHGNECYVKNKDVINYCNTSHYVYLAYFPNGKIKVGTASEVKKYNRLLEQGALSAIYIAKTPTGKIARQIEKQIIDNGLSGAVSTVYKMKNIYFTENTLDIEIVLIEKYKEILKYISNKQYLIEPEFISYEEIKDQINKKMLSCNEQISLFNEEKLEKKKYIIKKELNNINGKYLFALGKILAIENNGIVELIDTKKMEGYLHEIKNLNHQKNIKI